MSDLGGSPWWVVVAGAVPSAMSALWVFWRWTAERSDRNKEGTLSRGEREARELLDQRTALSKDNQELFDRYRAELLRTQGRLTEVERGRDRGWYLARYWNRRAYEMRNAALNAQTVVIGLCPQLDMPVPTWPDMTMVGLEEPT